MIGMSNSSSMKVTYSPYSVSCRIWFWGSGSSKSEKLDWMSVRIKTLNILVKDSLYFNLNISSKCWNSYEFGSQTSPKISKERTTHMTYQKYVWPSFYYFQQITVHSHFFKNPTFKNFLWFSFFIFSYWIFFSWRMTMSSYRFLTNERSKITSVSPKNELQPKYTLSLNSFLLVYNIREGKSRTFEIDWPLEDLNSTQWGGNATVSPFIKVSPLKGH